MTDDIEIMKGALQKIAALEPELNTLPLDHAFRALREITKTAREALEALRIS